MRILVCGGGVVGVTTAYYLARQGHEVEVIERREGPAEETSFANAGQVSPGYSAPWAAPGVPLKALRWLTMRHGPLVIRPRLDPAMWGWLLRMLGNCTSARYALNKARMVPLAEYSRDRLRELRADAGIAYDEGSGGTLQLFRTQKQLDSVGGDVAVLRQIGVPHAVLDRAGCIAAEPALAHAAADFVGGLRLPGDETGDCRMFTQRLAAVAALIGVRFTYDTEVRAITASGGAVSGAVTSRGPREADACVVALGSHSPAMVAGFGLRLPICPVKGYSLTMPVADPERAPVSTIMDETYKTAITRLGRRIRVGGTAELAGFDPRLRADRRAALEHSFAALFPHGGRLDEASFWTGFRPMTPDGPPIIGETPVRGLYLNTGHGTLGWTMACGSARVLSDIIGGRAPEIDVSGLALTRYA
ncbi:D-amino acid dehydrogenase [Aquibium sp. A9E412]|uniref:D-amino acid dehydrogenase n=1 Tax=Aquibium sp. A9E412 TaxID=2976767 RepID=UPI0025B230BF|nr:D-amino acid dehydrogenase [Aquibium sp. A9E412]MDN2565485.1 D-amino acid dehydrogenase [Aquibium sp. A9E412]